MHTMITREHVTSVSVDDDSVTARAEYATESFCLDANSEVSLRWGADVDYKSERESAARNAVAGVIEKLQAIVDARFPIETASADPKFDRVPVGEKIEAGDCEDMVTSAAEAPLESEAEQSWRTVYEPIYQKLFGDMQISIPTRLEMPALEEKMREIVDGRTSLTRNFDGAPGWIIGGVPIKLEGVLQRSDRAFESLVRGIVMTR